MTHHTGAKCLRETAAMGMPIDEYRFRDERDDNAALRLEVDRLQRLCDGMAKQVADAASKPARPDEALEARLDASNASLAALLDVLDRIGGWLPTRDQDALHVARATLAEHAASERFAVREP
jgi:hypothetical protein